MTEFLDSFRRFMNALEAPGNEIPAVGVHFFRHGEELPKEVLAYAPSELTLTSCQATKQAGLGDPVLLNLENIGCVAAAISFGFVDQNQNYPLQGARIYTDLMRQQSTKNFQPPTPEDFTSGKVYACRNAGYPQFCLFGAQDTGRFQNQETAQNAVLEMAAIQPAVMQGVFLYPPDFTDFSILPEVVVLSIRPVELTRIVQAYQYRTGKRIEASMGGLRAVNSDLIVRPYLTQKINVSPYCLGARLIGRYEADRLGIGIPYSLWTTLVEGMEESKGGFPFSKYPGAIDTDDG